MHVYDIGDFVTVTVTFTVIGVATDPSTLTAKVKAPDGAVTTSIYGTDAALVRDSVGVYRIVVSASAAGAWYYRFAATGAAAGAEEGTFWVRTSAFP